jgi:hypothetical protein
MYALARATRRQKEFIGLSWACQTRTAVLDGTHITKKEVVAATAGFF